MPAHRRASVVHQGGPHDGGPVQDERSRIEEPLGQERGIGRLYEAR